MDINQKIADALSVGRSRVDAAVRLMDEGNTVPFIARYRKEATGTLNDTQLREIRERLTALRGLEKRREEILAAIIAQGKLTEELSKAIRAADSGAALEDLYLPYRKKRVTRASAAQEKGLGPLADILWRQDADTDPIREAAAFVNPEKNVNDVTEALNGARDILAERIAENARVRGSVRLLTERTAVLRTKCAKPEDTVFSMYHDYAEKLSKLPAHRVLAVNRGEKTGVLKVSLETDSAVMETAVWQKTVNNAAAPAGEFVAAAGRDALKRLIMPSIENELRAKAFQQAAEQAIGVFRLNMRPLLMQPPLRGHVVMGFDPAYRTGCKIAVVDETGRVLDVAVVYPMPPQNKKEEAKKILNALIEKHGVTAIAVGNGTAGKESEWFLREMLQESGARAEYSVVSEAGASVYSASALGAEEFPQYDVSLRSAISIARRLQDPLAELVKIDPKAIGVGQYQHDMPEARLEEALSGVVEDCVNTVGVDVNTASVSLLSYVSGIGPALAKNIVAYREQNGRFSSRRALTDVPKLGKKAFEQAAGFLRITDGEEPLDATGVHPESYGAARKLLKRLSVEKSGYAELGKRADAVGREALAEELGIGLPTLNDMILEIEKPGRDPREELQRARTASTVKDISDLRPGMVLEGTVRNVVDFGAFVDIGVHQDGLVHISRICDRYIRHPSEAVRVGDTVRVRVLEADEKRKRISLTMLDTED